MIGALLHLGAVALLGWELVATIRSDRRRRRGQSDDGDWTFGDADGGGGDCGGDGGCD